MSLRRFKLMADYQCWPLWETSGGGLCNVDPTALGLSKALSGRLEAWADRYDATLKSADPLMSGFGDDAARLAFEEEGLALWWQLQLALPEAEVSYFSELFQRLYGPK